MHFHHESALRGRALRKVLRDHIAGLVGWRGGAITLGKLAAHFVALAMVAHLVYLAVQRRADGSL